MPRLSLSSGLVWIGLLASGMVLAQSSSSSTCHSNGDILRPGDNFSRGVVPASSASGVPSLQPVQKFQLEVGAVSINQSVIVLHNPAQDKSYPVKIDKSVKLSADKRIMKRKPGISDFSKGDAVKVTLNLFERRVLEIKLIESGNSQAAR